MSCLEYDEHSDFTSAIFECMISLFETAFLVFAWYRIVKPAPPVLAWQALRWSLALSVLEGHLIGSGFFPNNHVDCLSVRRTQARTRKDRLELGARIKLR